MLLFAALVTSGTAMIATGQPETAPEAPDFTEVDINQSGSLSEDEAALVEGLDFDAADKDQNGVLSEEEYNAAIGGGAILFEGETPLQGEETAD
jgi:hypothetical protein